MSANDDRNRIEVLAPTVVPALPGFRGAVLYLGSDATAEMTEDDIRIEFDPIIAWIVRPVLVGRGTREERMDEPEVTPVYITGPSEERSYIVDPSGQWTTYSQTYANEQEVRRAWLREKRARTEGGR